MQARLGRCRPHLHKRVLSVPWTLACGSLGTDVCCDCCQSLCEVACGGAQRLLRHQNCANSLLAWRKGRIAKFSNADVPVQLRSFLLFAEYIGCFKIRNVADERMTVRGYRWYDPHHMIFFGDDSRYAEGPFYAVRAALISGILRSGLTPRMGGPEGEHETHVQISRHRLSSPRKYLCAAQIDTFPALRISASAFEP